MKDRIKTLVLMSNGGLNRKRVLMDTFLCGFLGFKLKNRKENLSYELDWEQAFCESPRLDVRLCNVLNLVDYFKCLRNIKEYPLIIVLHSAGHEGIRVLEKTSERFEKRDGILVVFVGNEYKDIDKKTRFIRLSGADYVCSQLSLKAAQSLYVDCSDSKILSVPHALNPRVYYPVFNSPRSIDIGFIGNLYHKLIGDMERTNLIRFFQAVGADLGLNCDIRTHRLPFKQWRQFLNNCKGIIGAESGTYYLDKRGSVIENAIAYNKANPSASFEEVFENVFKNSKNTFPGKTISSRHFEAIGVKTCQILVEGDYAGILHANVHYIAVKKDLSNIEEVVERFKNDDYRQEMVDRTYEYVISEHTYQHRVKYLLDIVGA